MNALYNNGTALTNYAVLSAGKGPNSGMTTGAVLGITAGVVTMFMIIIAIIFGIVYYINLKKDKKSKPLVTDNVVM